MLSYRHAFHAGNHADVLKHLVQMQLLAHLGTKPKPFWYIDTHAGAGRYTFGEGFAARQQEYVDGIGRLWQAPELPAPIAAYVELVRSLNPGGKLVCYPGSPVIARQCLRAQDRLWLHELHPADYALLEREFSGDRKRAHLRCADGFTALKTLLPPEPRRALVLIDPPYELRTDYQQLRQALADALRRFATGTLMVWYPLIPGAQSLSLPRQLKSLPARSWLHATLSVKAPSDDGFGLHGSGVFVINPPFTLPSALQAALPALSRLLEQGEGGGFELEFHLP